MLSYTLVYHLPLKNLSGVYSCVYRQLGINLMAYQNEFSQHSPYRDQIMKVTWGGTFAHYLECLWRRELIRVVPAIMLIIAGWN